MADHGTYKPATQTIHAAQHVDPPTGAIVTPIYQCSTFAFEDCQQGADRFSGKSPGFIYTRMGNPTTRAFEQCIAELEGGYDGLATGSGMAAISTVFFTFLSAGQHVICTNSVYGPTRVVLEKHFSRFGVESSCIDTGDLAQVEAALRPNTRMIYLETPANPTMRISDIEACAKLAHQHGALLVVDNTFASPILQNPLALGADVVLHSITKFINGHADVVGGVIVAATPELYKQMRGALNHLGGTMDPHQSWLVLRGVKSLALRVKEGQRNAQRIAEFLAAHPKVEWVKYPGLPSFPQQELAEKQMRGSGALMSFGLKGGLEAGRRLLDNVKLMTLAVSLGGIETLIQHPASMTHASMGSEARAEAGISDGLVRLSAGCEDIDDLLADLAQALEQV